MFYVISKFLLSLFNSNSVQILIKIHVFVYVCSWRAYPAVLKVVH